MAWIRRLLSDGERALLLDIYDRCASMVLALAHSKMPPQEAEDVLYAVMERLIPHLSCITLLSEPQQKAYVYAAARSEVADRLRRRARERANAAEEMPEIADPDSDVERQIVQQEDVAALRRALGRLPEQHRRLLEMRYVLEMDSEEIGRHLGMRPEAVRQQLRRLRLRLRSQMEEE